MCIVFFGRHQDPSFVLAFIRDPRCKPTAPPPPPTALRSAAVGTAPYGCETGDGPPFLRSGVRCLPTAGRGQKKFFFVKTGSVSSLPIRALTGPNGWRLPPLPYGTLGTYLVGSRLGGVEFLFFIPSCQAFLLYLINC